MNAELGCLEQGVLGEKRKEQCDGNGDGDGRRLTAMDDATLYDGS